MTNDGQLRFLLFSHPSGKLTFDLPYSEELPKLVGNRRERAKQVCNLAFPSKRFGAASIRGGAEEPGLHVVEIRDDTAGITLGLSIDDLLQTLKRGSYVAFVAFR